MALTIAVNNKANIKEKSNADLNSLLLQPVVNKFMSVSTASQTVINLPFIQDTASTDNFELVVDGKMLTIGSDFTFTSVDGNGGSSQITMTNPLASGLNIMAIKRGLKKERENLTDSRFTQIYSANAIGFQDFVDESSTIAPTTSIVNRARITDLANDLKPRMGIERIPTQQIVRLQNEFGASGEPVYSLLNDDRGLIRFVGQWSNNTAADGTFPSTATSGDYVEITFYGTGLNLLFDAGYSSLNMLPAIDGGSNGANIFAAAYSNVLDGRNYVTNQVLNVYTAQTLGVHTVKLTNNSTNAVKIHGFEILNESSNIKTNPGSSYQRLQKLANSSQSVVAYNTGFELITQDGATVGALGSRGAHALIYQKSDGTIGKAAYIPSAASATSTSANHQYEDQIRTYFWREFGAGRSDDFSLAITAGNNYAFTLDDGTATLVGSSVANTLTNTINPQTNGSFITLTFVGTGLDLIVQDSTTGGSDTFNFQIDGGSTVSWPYTAGTAGQKLVKIVSGLPYGTHTFKFNRVTAATFTPGIQQFIVYGPKKPTLPSGAVELVDYYIPANYVVTSVQAANAVSTGVLRKAITREMIYVGSFGAVTLDATADVGFFTLDSTASDYIQYTFFGTGIEIRAFSSTTSTSQTISIDGVTNLTGAGYTTSFYGTGAAFNGATGSATITSGSATYGAGWTITNIPLGVHTVKIARVSGTNSMQITALDIITPIHSPKSNIYADLQNTLPVGSCGLSDNRQTQPIKNPNNMMQKAWAQAVGVTSGPTLNSVTSPVPMPDMSLTLKTTGNPIEVYYSVSLTSNLAANGVYTRVYIDGVAVGTQRDMTGPANGYRITNSDSYIIPLSPGVHKIDLYWSTDPSNIGTATGVERVLKAREL